MRAVTGRAGFTVAIVVAALGGISVRRADAQVSIVHEPDRPSLLFSADSNQDCSELSMLEGDALPYHVVRLRAVPPGADKYIWSLPKPQQGFLLADQDLGPADTTAAVRGLCGEFGNACILTKESLRFYNLSTVLYAAPTCDVLPTKTNKSFGGGRVQIKVTVKAGRKKLGKAVTTVVYGDPRVAGVTLYAFGDDGEGKDAAAGYIDTDFNAVPTPAVPPNGPVTAYEFRWADDAETAPACPSTPEAMCVTLEEELAGTFLGTVEARLGDGSALCDNLNVHVGPCPRKAQLQIIRVPSKSTYTTGDVVHLRVRFANLSRNDPECLLELEGANVFNCSATFTLGQSEETRTTQWDFRHCSATTTRPCDTDAECPASEVCLTTSHCSTTLDQACTGDSDCEPSNCADCEDDETCVRVLAVRERDVFPGEAVDLVDEFVTVKNDIGDKVSVAETWTARAEPLTTAEASIKYKIKGE
jgi:hypothetical protein